jgi:hypothetical protein
MDEVLTWAIVFGWSIVGYGAILFYAWYHATRPKRRPRQNPHRVPGE